jgi:hypothetical protein
MMVLLYATAPCPCETADQQTASARHPGSLKVTMCNTCEDARHGSRTFATVRTATQAADRPVHIIVFIGILEPASGLEPPTC